MNCAWVHIVNGASKGRRSYRRDASSFNALPDIFLADIGAKGNNVQTIEGFEPTFPYPGSIIEYGGSVNAATPLGQGFSGTPPAQNIGNNPNPSPSGTSTPTTSSSSTLGTPSAPSNSPGIFVPFPMSNTTRTTFCTNSADCPDSTATVSQPASNSAAATTTQQDSLPTATATPSPPTTSTDTCSPGVLLCPSPNTFALCNADGTPTTPQAVAPGTQCSNGNIILADNSGPCDSPAGTWLCRDGGMSFSSCSNGYWINMGSVAAGTVCRDGAIVAS